MRAAPSQSQNRSSNSFSYLPLPKLPTPCDAKRSHFAARSSLQKRMAPITCCAAATAPKPVLPLFTQNNVQTQMCSAGSGSGKQICSNVKCINSDCCTQSLSKAAKSAHCVSGNSEKSKNPFNFFLSFAQTTILKQNHVNTMQCPKTCTELAKLGLEKSPIESCFAQFNTET